jgi:hypothetical protein
MLSLIDRFFLHTYTPIAQALRMEVGLLIFLPDMPAGSQVEFDVGEELLCKIRVMIPEALGITEEDLASVLFKPAE